MRTPPFVVVEMSSAQRDLMQKLAHRLVLWVDVSEALLEMSQLLMPEAVQAGHWAVVNHPVRRCHRLGDDLGMKIRSEVCSTRRLLWW